MCFSRLFTRKKLQNYFLTAFLMSLPLSYACSNRIVPEFLLDGNELETNEARVYAEILTYIPIESNIDAGVKFLAENGFSCREVSGEIELNNTTFNTFTHCQYTSPGRACSSFWGINLLHKDTKVKHILVEVRTDICL